MQPQAFDLHTAYRGAKNPLGPALESAITFIIPTLLAFGVSLYLLRRPIRSVFRRIDEWRRSDEELERRERDEKLRERLARERAEREVDGWCPSDSEDCASGPGGPRNG